MSTPPIADVIELEQLLARYAVGMTKDDVDAVVEVFTPDGTYSAFGDTYRLVDFPTLVAAAPKGLFLVGPPVLEIDGDTGLGRAAAVLRRPDQPRHAHRLLHRHLPPDGGRMAPPDPGDDLSAEERGPGLGAGPRSHPSPTRRPVTGGDLRSAVIADFRQSVDSWLDENTRCPRPRIFGNRDARPADGPAVQGQADGLRCRMDALRVAGAGRGARGLDSQPRLSGRGPHRPGSGRARALLDDRGAGADDGRLCRS